MDRDCVNKRGLDLSKQVLGVSVGQRAADLPGVGGLKKNSAAQPSADESGSNRAEWQNFFLTSNFDSPQFCCPLTYRDPQYLFRKI